MTWHACELNTARRNSSFHSDKALLLIYIRVSLSFYIRRQLSVTHVVYNKKGYSFLQASIMFWSQSILALSANSSSTHFCVSGPAIQNSEFNVSQSEDALSYVRRPLYLCTYCFFLLESLPLVCSPGQFLFKPQLRHHFLHKPSQVSQALLVFKFTGAQTTLDCNCVSVCKSDICQTVGPGARLYLSLDSQQPAQAWYREDTQYEHE